MKRLWWRIRVAYWLKCLSVCSFIDAWQCSRDFHQGDYFTEGYSPRAAVETDMSYWEFG